jgi:hypothetical protein
MISSSEMDAPHPEFLVHDSVDQRRWGMEIGAKISEIDTELMNSLINRTQALSLALRLHSLNN